MTYGSSIQAMTFTDPPHTLLVYVEARVLRIFPALWVTLLLSVVVLGPLVTTLEPSA